MLRSHDIIIVGAGPVGLYTASLLEKTLNVLVLEQQKVIGHKACSGLISTNIDRFLNPGDSVEHKVSGAVLHSPSNTVIELKKKKTAAYVINRKRFDRLLAENLSCPVKTGVFVKEIKNNPDGISVKTTQGNFKSKVLIGCDGAASTIGQHINQRPSEILTGLVALTEEKNRSKNVDLFFNKNFVRDGFLWKIPRGHATEYGAMGSGINFSVLESFFKIKNYEKRAAPIPIGSCKTFSDRILLTGDAAGQVKPWSGGGIIFGFTAARIAARTLRTCFRKNDFTSETLETYEKEWKKEIGKEISFGLIGREMLKDLTNEELDNLFRNLQTRKFSHLDMDFPVFSSLG